MSTLPLTSQKAAIEQRLTRCQSLKAMFKNHPTEGGRERYSQLKDREADLKQRLYEINLAIQLEMEQYQDENR